MDQRNRPGRSDSENGNRPGQSNSQNGRPDRAGQGAGVRAMRGRGQVSGQVGAGAGGRAVRGRGQGKAGRAGAK